MNSGDEPANPVAAEGKQAADEVIAGRPGRAARHWLAYLTVILVVLFALDALAITTYGYLPFDRPVELFVQQFPWGPVTYVFEAINWLGGTKQLIFGLLMCGAVALWDRRGGWLMLVGSLSSLWDNLLKSSFARHRPTADLVSVINPETGYSFPSGHAVFFTWLAVMLAASIAPRISPRLRPPLWWAAGLLALFACLARVWAGVHWPSDVIGGFLLGLAWSAFVLWLPERWLPSPSWSWIRRGRRIKAA